MHIRKIIIKLQEIIDPRNTLYTETQLDYEEIQQAILVGDIEKERSKNKCSLALHFRYVL